MAIVNTGEITAVGQGTATVTATIVDNENVFSRTASVIVKEITELAPEAKITAKTGDVIPLPSINMATLNDGTQMDVAITWTGAHVVGGNQVITYTNPGSDSLMGTNAVITVKSISGKFLA